MKRFIRCQIHLLRMISNFLNACNVLDIYSPSSPLVRNPSNVCVSVCRAVGNMGQRKSGGLGAAAPISTEEEQLKFQDSRFLATLVLGRSR